jgi:hypothetical protein
MPIKKRTCQSSESQSTIENRTLTTKVLVSELSQMFKVAAYRIAISGQLNLVSQGDACRAVFEVLLRACRIFVLFAERFLVKSREQRLSAVRDGVAILTILQEKLKLYGSFSNY